jgi:hypothetical protein
MKKSASNSNGKIAELNTNPAATIKMVKNAFNLVRRSFTISLEIGHINCFILNFFFSVIHRLKLQIKYKKVFYLVNSSENNWFPYKKLTLPNPKIVLLLQQILRMKQVLIVLFLMIFSVSAMAQNEVGPEGHKLIWFALVFAIAGIVAFFWANLGKSKPGFKIPFFNKPKVHVELTKDRLYYPDYLELTVTNTGKTDVDIDTPLLVFSGMWYSRKFKLRGTNNNHYYPLYLMQGQNHTLNIDLNRFYGFDKTLKRLPRVKVVVSDVNGKKLGSRKVLLRKTLFNM